MKINENYKNLEESYLFSTIAKKVDEYTKAHPCLLYTSDAADD